MKKPAGRLPFGYYRENDQTLINEDEKKIILDYIYNPALNGASVISIKNTLNSKKIPSPSGKPNWSPNSVTYFFADKRLKYYCGLFEDGNHGYWPKIIDVSFADKIRNKNVIKTRKTPAKRNTYLLSNIDLLYCGYCNSLCSNLTSVLQNGVLHYYYCSGKRIFGKEYCPNSKSHNMAEIDNLVLTKLLEIEKNVKEYKKYTAANNEKELELSNSKIAKINDSIQAILSKDKSSSSANTMQKNNDSLIELLNQRNEISNSLEPLFDFAVFKKLGVKDILKFNKTKQKKVIPEIVKKIVLHNDRMEMYFPFCIDNKFNKKITVTI